MGCEICLQAMATDNLDVAAPSKFEWPQAKSHSELLTLYPSICCYFQVNSAYLNINISNSKKKLKMESKNTY